MIRFLFALVALILVVSPLAAQAPMDLEKLKIAYTRFTLSNGLTVLVHEDHSAPIVAVNSWYHVGSKNEVPGRTGFAHLFEHFFFNGSANYPHGFREAMDDLGANNRNGTTNNDRTNFFEDVPVGALERTLYLEADRLGFLGGYLTQEMLERERGVVKNEKRQGENRPYGRVWNRIVETMYPASHPYSWPVIGRMEDLDAAALADIKKWYQTYYSPNNVVLSLAGDITPARARELAEKYYGSIPPGSPVTRYERWIPKLDADVRDEMQDRVPQTRVHRVWHAPRWGDKELAYLELFAQALAGGKSSPLVRELVYEKGLATETSASIDDHEISSLFAVDATLKAGTDAAAAEKAMADATLRFAKRGPSPAELARAKASLTAAFARNMERLGGFSGRSDILAESMIYGGTPDAYLERLKTISSATPEQVGAAARKWLGEHHYALIVTPFKEGRPGALTIDRKKLPELGGAPKVGFPAVQRATLKNGLKVMLLERHAAPLVKLALAADAGFASDPKGKSGLASLGLGLMSNGTTTRDLYAISNELESLGATLRSATSADLSTLYLTTLSPNLGKALDLLADIALHPSYPQSVFEIERKKRVEEIGQAKADPTDSAERLLPTLAFPASHPYAAPFDGSGDAAAVAGLTRADLVAWRDAWLRPGGSTLIVTGDVSLAKLLPLLEKSFGTWPAGRGAEKIIPEAVTTNSGKVYLVDKPDALQSVITAIAVVRPGGGAVDVATDVFMRNFGRMPTSRLNRNLRLDKHWSYGAWSYIEPAHGRRPLMIVAPVQTDKTKEALAEVVKEVRDIAGARPIAGEEYASIMRNVVMRLPGRFETLAAVEGAAVEILTFGYPDDWFSNYAANMSKLSEKDLAAAAAEIVRPADLVWLVVGDRKKIEAGLRELNLGPVVMIDPDGKPVP